MDDLIKQGAAAFKAGDLETARNLLAEAIKQSPDDERAWGWMYNVSLSDQERILYLKQMLRINPNNEKAQSMLLKLENQEKDSQGSPNTINKSSAVSSSEDSSSQDHGMKTSANSVTGSQNSNFSKGNFLTSALILLLILSVGWLFYKVNKLEKSLSYVQELAENADRYAHTHNNFSDRRLKKDISEINEPLSKILSLNGVSYFWNISKYPELGLQTGPQIGFIAQDLEKVFPELVNSGENGFKTVDYDHLIPVLVEAIKQQQSMIADLEQQIIEIQSNSR